MSPQVWTESELTRHQARAVWHAANGHRIRGLLLRLLVTELGDLLRGRVWPEVPDAR